MFQIWLYSLISVVAVSLASLIGVFALAIKEEALKKLLIFLVSLSAGVLLGDAFFHIFPEIVNESGYTIKLGFLLILGIFIFFVLEKYIHWHHCHKTNNSEHLHHLGAMNLFGDGLHNFLDGLIIGASYLVSIPLGLATTLAIIFHEIPQEISDFGVLLHSGFTKKKALLYNLLSALVAVVGTVLGLLLRNRGLTQIMLPIAAAGFIYIAMADLIPELHKETKVSRSFLQLFSFIFGILIMYLFTFYEN